MAFEFSYDDMVDGYYNQRNNETFFSKDPELICFMIKATKKYEAASKKQKKDESMPKLSKKQGYLGAFVKRHIDQDHIRKLKFIDGRKKPNGQPFYPLGIYIMLDMDKRKRESNVFFVFPTPKENWGHEIITGDHYSFMYDKNDATNPVHLHLTSYVPKGLGVDIGLIDRTDNYFPDGVIMPLNGYKCAVFDHMSYLKDDLLDLCRFYTKVENGGVGGAKRRRSRISSENVSDGISKALEEKLLKREINGVFAVGYKHDRRWHMTVNFEWNEGDETESENSKESDISDGDMMAFIIDHPTFASFQAELTRKLGRDL